MPCFCFPLGYRKLVSLMHIFFTAGHIAQRRPHQVCKKANDAYTESEVKMCRYLESEISALMLGTT